MTTALACARTHRASVAAWAVVLWANFAGIALLPPPLFVFQIVVDLFLGCAVLAGMWSAEKTRADNAVLRADVAEVEARIAEDLLDRFKADARVVVPIKTRLHSVPEQRKPPQNADDGWWSRLYGQEDKA